jgi:hypothetical protein
MTGSSLMPERIRDADRRPVEARYQRTVLRCEMDRDRLEKALERAEERIVLSEKQIARQKEIIAELERAGQDTVQAKGLLAVFRGHARN